MLINDVSSNTYAFLGGGVHRAMKVVIIATAKEQNKKTTEKAPQKQITRGLIFRYSIYLSIYFSITKKALYC